MEKLHQIALYYQLGLKRNEIRDLMRDPNYDSNQVLGVLLENAQEDRIQLVKVWRKPKNQMVHQ